MIWGKPTIFGNIHIPLPSILQTFQHLQALGILIREEQGHWARGLTRWHQVLLWCADCYWSLRWGHNGCFFKKICANCHPFLSDCSSRNQNSTDFVDGLFLWFFPICWTVRVPDFSPASTSSLVPPRMEVATGIVENATKSPTPSLERNREKNNPKTKRESLTRGSFEVQTVGNFMQIRWTCMSFVTKQLQAQKGAL